MPKFVLIKAEVMTHSRPDSLKKWLQDLVNTKGDKITIHSIEETGTSWESKEK